MNTVMLALVLSVLPTAPKIPAPAVPPAGCIDKPADGSTVTDLSALRGTYDPARVSHVSFGLVCWNRQGAYLGDWDEGRWSPSDVGEWKPTLLDHGTWIPLITLPTRAQLPPGGQCSVDVMATNRDGGVVTRFRHTIKISTKA
ncbi:MAG TPA: hypothetical protein VG755_20160 [Nannocystaceae bacterium]|nr:hypothetical protein [Nannocystaceae bacterium]